MLKMSDKREVFTPDLSAVGVRRGIKRAHLEMRSRMRSRYSLARQQEIMNARVAMLTSAELSSAAQRLVERDAAEFTQMIETLTNYRLAAALIIKGLNEGTIDPHSFDFSNDAHWESDNGKA